MHDVIIIGGGIAAWSAALFSSRRGLKTLVIAKDIGGQANYTDLIENYPGVEETGGYELISTVRGQAQGFGAEYLSAEAAKIKAAEDGSFITSAYNKQYKSKSIILCHGKTPMDLNVPGENELKGKGVSYCANCDMPLYKNKIVAIAGIGDMAADAALLAAKFAKRVYVLSKTDKFVAHPGLTKLLFKKKNVELVPNIQIFKVVGEEQVTGLRLNNLQTNSPYDLAIDALFVELGYVVDSHLVENVVKLDSQGQVIINHDQSTSVAGIFAAGDATNRPYKQAVISAGEGAAAALACFDWLQRQQGGSGMSSDWTQIKKVN